MADHPSFAGARQWHVQWAEVLATVDLLARRHEGQAYDGVFGVPRGGVVPAALVASVLDLPLLRDGPTSRSLVVDDLVDTGAVASTWADRGAAFDALYRKSWAPLEFAAHAKAVPGDAWIVFPWEHGWERVS